ncbi:MAG TPA: hypothetical protein PKV38_06390 [bacterium]|nr:hypothetical protein [bacterium]
MSKQQAAMLACRILAIYAFMQGVMGFASLGMVPFYLQNPTPRMQEWLMAFSSVSPGLYMLTFAAILWLFANRIAYYMTMDMPPGEVWSGIQVETVLRMGCVLCGLFILGNAVTNLSGTIAYFYLFFHQRQAILVSQPEMVIRPVTESVAFLLKVVIGAWFAARPNQVIRLLRRVTGEDRES